MKKPIIGICGKASSGKDTSAKYLVEKYGYVQISLAEPIKDFSKHLFGFSQEQLWGSSKHRNEEIAVNWDKVYEKFDRHAYQWLSSLYRQQNLPEFREFFYTLKEEYPHEISARHALQKLGTEGGRNVLGESVWIDHFIGRAEFHMHEGDCMGVVTSDVRFQNEMDVIKSHDGKLIRLLRNQYINTGILNHQSEIEQDLVPQDIFNFILNNNDSIDSLYRNLDVFLGVI